MRIVCQNCGHEFETGYPMAYNISMCPKCGAPFVQDGIGVTWGLNDG